ncbi:MAG: gamma-glutamylcyclotransferase family protein [Nocardioidaceae bacterium]
MALRFHRDLVRRLRDQSGPSQDGRTLSPLPHHTIGWLEGWRLTFGGEEHGWDGSLATIVPDPGERVFVAVYDVTDKDVAQLDQWVSADTGLYKKLKVRVTALAGDTLAWVYVLNAYEGGLPRQAIWGSWQMQPRQQMPPLTTSRHCAHGRVGPTAAEVGPENKFTSRATLCD